MHPVTGRDGPTQAALKTKRLLTLSLPLSQRRTDSPFSRRSKGEKEETNVRLNSEFDSITLEGGRWGMSEIRK